MTQAYNQPPPPPNGKRRRKTTFARQMSLKYRYKRLNNRTYSAAKVLQYTPQHILRGIPGVCNLADDILVFIASYHEHNKALEDSFQWLQDHEITLNVASANSSKEI